MPEYYAKKAQLSYASTSCKFVSQPCDTHIREPANTGSLTKQSNKKIRREEKGIFFIYLKDAATLEGAEKSLIVSTVAKHANK